RGKNRFSKFQSGLSGGEGGEESGLPGCSPGRGYAGCPRGQRLPHVCGIFLSRMFQLRRRVGGRRLRGLLLFPILGILLAVSVVCTIRVGSTDIPAGEVFGI